MTVSDAETGEVACRSEAFDLFAKWFYDTFHFILCLPMSLSRSRACAVSGITQVPWIILKEKDFAFKRFDDGIDLTMWKPQNIDTWPKSKSSWRWSPQGLWWRLQACSVSLSSWRCTAVNICGNKLKRAHKTAWAPAPAAVKHLYFQFLSGKKICCTFCMQNEKNSIYKTASPMWKP